MPKKPTQKEIVLRELRCHRDGVRSDLFLWIEIPRAAARIAELKKEGYNISSTREKQFCRYILHENVEEGRSAGRERPGQTGYESGGWDSSPSAVLLGALGSVPESTTASTLPEASGGSSLKPEGVQLFLI